jgi:hypothetical protein
MTWNHIQGNDVADKDGGWNVIADEAMHERVSAAIALIFEHTDPRAVRARTAEDVESLARKAQQTDLSPRFKRHRDR